MHSLPLSVSRVSWSQKEVKLSHPAGLGSSTERTVPDAKRRSLSSLITTHPLSCSAISVREYLPLGKCSLEGKHLSGNHHLFPPLNVFLTCLFEKNENLSQAVSATTNYLHC